MLNIPIWVNYCTKIYKQQELDLRLTGDCLVWKARLICVSVIQLRSRGK